jgi:hypothetical protein
MIARLEHEAEVAFGKDTLNELDQLTCQRDVLGGWWQGEDDPGKCGDGCPWWTSKGLIPKSVRFHGTKKIGSQRAKMTNWRTIGSASTEFAFLRYYDVAGITDAVWPTTMQKIYPARLLFSLPLLFCKLKDQEILEAVYRYPKRRQNPSRCASERNAFNILFESSGVATYASKVLEAELRFIHLECQHLKRSVHLTWGGARNGTSCKSLGADCKWKREPMMARTPTPSSDPKSAALYTPTNN